MTLLPEGTLSSVREIRIAEVKLEAEARRRSGVKEAILMGPF